jgi:hypothetical protein
MSINAKQLRELIIRPTLKDMGMWSESAENLLMGTAAQESHLGAYIKQVGKGPALGIYQCEPFTHEDVVKWAREKYLGAIVGANHDRLIYDLKYATMICRLHYYRAPKALPEADDIEGMASYWKRFYNSSLGKGKPEEFVRNYERYVING